MMRLFKRALRRAGLPVAMSNGFNPRPRISLPAPLGVGLSAQNEIFDFELTSWLNPSEVKERLSEQLPEGIKIRSVSITQGKPDREPKRFSYHVPLINPHPVEDSKIEKLLNCDQVMVTREKKKRKEERNIAPFLTHIRLRGNDLYFQVAVSNKGTAKPEEVLQALGCVRGKHYSEAAMERTHVSLSSSL